MAQETPWDVSFELFGIPIRIHPIFWLSSAYLVWDPEQPAFVFLGVICLLISVLVHELGHAVMCRRYGFPSEIVLYFLGGYATSTRFSTWKNVKVSFAGPAAGLVLFLLLYYSRLIPGVTEILDQYVAARRCMHVLLFFNLMVNLMNLVPCLPLDGGQIMQALMYRYWPRRAGQRIQQICIVASGLTAFWSLYCLQNDLPVMPIPRWMLPGPPFYVPQPDPKFLVFFFGFLCANSVAEYNESQGR
ncbi:MAG: site-2 protease family protein [Planctomycetaceae bacterium]